MLSKLPLTTGSDVSPNPSLDPFSPIPYNPYNPLFSIRYLFELNGLVSGHFDDLTPQSIDLVSQPAQAYGILFYEDVPYTIKKGFRD